MNKKPNLAIIHDWMTGFAGAEQQLLILHQLYPDAPIYTSIYAPEKMKPFKEAEVITSYLQRLPKIFRRQQILVPLMPAAFERFNLDQYETVFSISNGPAKGVLTNPYQRHIAYINTPMRYIWNLGGDNRAARGLAAWSAHSLREWDVVSAARPDLYYANSITVQKRIKKIYRRDSEVLYPPVNTDKFLPSYKKPEPFFISVGRLVGYKRVDLVIQAFQQTGYNLKIIGDGPERKNLEKLASSSKNIQFCGRVSDEVLKEMYANTRAFVFPSEEDFGIVPVEAMSAGRPVLAYGRGGVTETVIDTKTGLFFKEQTPESLAEVLERFKDSDWDPKIIRDQALKFDQKIFREKVKTIIEKA